MSISTESKQRTYRVGRLPHHASGLMPEKCHSALAPFMLSGTLINSVEEVVNNCAGTVRLSDNLDATGRIEMGMIDRC